MRKLLLLIAVFTFSSTYAQRMQIGGTVRDTSATNPLPNAVAMAVRLSDSVLVDFTRSNETGLFSLKDLPLDTYQVIISHPAFAEAFYIVTGSPENHVFDFGKVVLPPKTQLLNEVTVLGFKDPVYYKGDTLIYTADSFKVKANATVEDLLKRLPGMKVDANGKITTQGKTVDKVLVDGDEFFGTDPTMATRNLNATSIESVQVYDKKNENPSDGGDETIKVLNLKLKEDAKKGYFGKVSGASDFQKFYEGEFLANRFNNKRKVSLFGLAGNTPKTSFNWDDIFKYGLDNELNRNSGDDGNSWYYMNNSTSGIPQTLKTGAYYSDKINKKTKLLGNYSYNQSDVKTSSETTQQYFLTDTTYTTRNSSYNQTASKGHSFNLGINSNIDSLTTLDLKPRFSYSTTGQSHNEINTFYSEDNVLTRQTNINNSDKTVSYGGGLTANFRRNFKKKDRSFWLNYNGNLNSTKGDGFVKTINLIDTSLSVTDVNQKKETGNLNYNNNVMISWTEPITKKLKIEFLFDYLNSGGDQKKEAFNFVNTEYSQKDSLFSNSFENMRHTFRPGAKFIYETKKTRFALAGRVRQVLATNDNLITGTSIRQNVVNFLPAITYRYKKSDNKTLFIGYYTGSNLPTMGQLQPVPNNANPNYITIGNPDLLPSYDHIVEFNYNSFRPITGLNLWSGVYSKFTNNDFSNSTSFDSVGRTVSQAVNVNGNANVDAWFGMGIPLFKKIMTINPNANAGYYSTTTYINGQKNITTNINTEASLELSANTDKINATIGYGYKYYIPNSTLNNETNRPYATQEMGAELTWQLPKKFVIGQDVTYTINSKRANGYNLNYVIWNASFGKKFGKKENLVITVEGFDLLNQNISTNRTVQSNVITDTKTAIIKRYFLLRVLYKFSSNKEKEEDEGNF
ncbi:MAG: hypothetical protein K0S33_1598 [Bacteroidetes bacterium]|jgi:hypothetical protein|nr:hypothetical protein [Bacteroidota bacterium]